MEKIQGNLIDFLKLNKTKDKTRVVKFDNTRLAGYEFKIRALTSKEILKIQSKNKIKTTNKKTSEMYVEQNPNELFDVIIAGLLEPNFNNVDVLKDLAVATPTDALNDFFTIEELQSMSTAIIEFSQTLQEENQEISEEIKN